MAFEGLFYKILDCTDATQRPFWQLESNYHEDFKFYRRGGYCPTFLYEELKDKQYSIEYKLGFGGSATVWLARDNHSLKIRHMALKVLTADTTAIFLEAQLFCTVAVSPDIISSLLYMIKILDEFEIFSANGIHQVLVLPVTHSVKSLLNSKIFFRSVVKSLFSGLSNIHSIGIIHARKDTLLLYGVANMD